MGADDNTERLQAMTDVLVAVAQGQYSSRIELDGSNDILDGLAMAINMTLDELEDNLESLERRVQERTVELSEKVRTIAQQNQTIVELSTPVIQVWENVLVLPLIGLIDATRGRQLMEDLLESIRKTGATTAIIDVTGVPVIDTAVSDYLLRTVAAAKLLGTEAILSGIRPDAAQTLVSVGVDLSSITTTATLQQGLERAIRADESEAEH